jgi:hypothetical protein
MNAKNREDEEEKGRRGEERGEGTAIGEFSFGIQEATED